MLGTFRLLLALFVALSHAHFSVMGLNPGVISVVGFYLISGYVMTGLVRGHYAGAARVPHFYLDRLLRLFPQYLLIAAITLAWYLAMRPESYFLGHFPGPVDIINNVTVVPLNYYMFNGSDKFTLIPPAWSLGAELQFYIVFPLLLLFRTRLAVFAIGMAVYAAAIFGFINGDWWGYRLLPGVLTFFLLGSFLYDARGTIRARSITIAGVAAAVCLWLALQRLQHLEMAYNRETLLGVAIGLPLLYLLARLPQNAWDNRLGDLSYGVFLNHFLIQWTVTGVPTTALGWVAYLGSSVLLSAFTQWAVERPVLAWRRNLRKKEEIEERKAAKLAA